VNGQSGFNSFPGQPENSTYDGELYICGSNFGTVGVDVFHPLLVLIKTISRDANDFDVAFGEIRGTACDFTKLSCANRGEISWVREENGL